MTFAHGGSQVWEHADSFDDIFAGTSAGRSGDESARYSGMITPDEIGPTFGVVESTLLAMPASDAMLMICRLSSRLLSVETQILARSARSAPGPGADRETENLSDPEGKKSKRDRKKAANRAAAAKNNPELTEQLSSGSISEEQLDQLAAADRKTDGAASTNTSLMEAVRRSNADQSRRLIKEFVDNHNAKDKETEHERQRRLREVTKFRTKDGLWALLAKGDKASIDAMYALLGNDADDLYRKDGGRDLPKSKHPRTHAQRMFDAFANRLRGRSTTNDGSRSGGSTSKATVVLKATVRPDGSVGDYGQIGNGPLPANVFERYVCNANIVGAVFDGNGQNLWLGRTKRMASPAQTTGLIARDEGCVLCRAPHSQCEAHHLMPWNAPGKGHTNIDQMALVCADCHHLIHDTKQTLYCDAGVWKLRAATRNETAPPRGPTSDSGRRGDRTTPRRE